MRKGSLYTDFLFSCGSACDRLHLLIYVHIKRRILVCCKFSVIVISTFKDIRYYIIL